MPSQVTVTAGAGRLLFALLLSPSNPSQNQLNMLTNVRSKELPACIDELKSVGLQQETNGEEDWSQPETEDWAQEELTMDELSPEEEIEEACRKADQIEKPIPRVRAQVAALARAWEYRYPKVNQVQGLSPEKAKDWLRVAKKVAQGQESSTVFGWMSGVDERLLEKKEFPLAYMNKVISIRASEQTPKNNGYEKQQVEVADDGEEEAMDGWRAYAQKLIEQRTTEGKTNGHKNGASSLERIARAVREGTS